MPFKKGQSKPPGSGIKKGQDQLRKTAVKEIIETALHQSIPERILQRLEEIKDKQFEVDVLLDLMPYCYPKLQAIEVQAQAAIDTSGSVYALVELLEKMNADK